MVDIVEYNFKFIYYRKRKIKIMRKIAVFLTMLFCILSVFVQAQVKTVSGKVINEKGAPVPFATIHIKGTKQGVSADAEGRFSIKASNDQTLQITGVGVTPKEIVVDNSTGFLSVEVSANDTKLTEVVVTALGIQRRARDLGYSTSKISNQTLTQAKVTDISTGLEGKISGLQVNLSDNGVAPNTRIVLRGDRSLTGNNQALLVIDGVPIDDASYIQKINPEDVDNITTLKGAVAAAIYGSKASNGVLIITTKHGSRNHPTIVLSNTTSFESVSYLPKLQNSFGGYGGEGGSYINADGTVNAVPYENESYGPAFNGSQIPLALSPIFAADGVTVTGYDTLFTKYSALPNEKRDFFNTGITNQANISYSAGDDKGTFYTSFQDVKVSGVVPGDNSRRDNLRIAGSRDYDIFHADYSFSYNQQNIDVAGLGYNQGVGTGGLTLNGHGVYFDVLNAPADIPITAFKDLNNVYASPNGYYNAYSDNPYWTIANSRNVTNKYDLLGSINLALKLTSWLTLSDRFGITQTTQQVADTRAGITFAPWAIADPWSAGNIPSAEPNFSPSDFESSFLEQRLNNDVIGTVNKNFGDFSLKALVGFNSQQRYQREFSVEGDNLQFPNDFNISSVLGVPGYAESFFKQREYSYYEDATIGYKDYLFLHLSNRDEWNSTLDPSNQHYEYPGADLAFIFTQAISGLSKSKVLSYGKIFGGLTQVANINLGTNPYGAYELVNPFVPPAGFPFGSLGGYSQASTYFDPQIQPEKTKEYEAGLDLGFLNNRIYLSGDYYQSQTSNQSLTSSVSAATGFTSKVVNLGLVTNKGVELDLTVIPIKSRNVTWNVGINYAHYSNLVNQLPGGNPLLLSTFPVDIGAIGGGIYAVQGKAFPVLEANDWLRDSATGKVIVDPTTGLPSIDPTPKVYGTTDPTDILGITTSVTYKAFTFSAVVEYRGGNYIMNSIGPVLDFTGISYHSAENGHQRFVFPNSVVMQNGQYVNNTTVAVDNGGNTGGHGFWPDNVYGTNIGSPYVTSGAFWKLREASITYELPSSIVAKTKFMKKATVGVVGRNLLMITPKSNIWTDPEFTDNTSTSGNTPAIQNAVGSTSDAQTPPTRFYGFNVTVTF
jgi:TonB-linked SusC/RagA family outer membrane protein